MSGKVIHKYSEVKPENEIDKLLYDKFTYPIKDKWLEVGEGKALLPSQYFSRLAKEIENLDVREDDIFVVSFPRSGTTWTMEMAWLIYNDCDFEAGRRLINGRYSYLEGSVFAAPELYKRILKYDKHMDIDQMLNNPDRPRYFKSHLPWYLLPKKIRDGTVKPKIIWVTRNPKDVAISEYHFYRTLQNFDASLNEFFKLFLTGRSHYGPYWTHFYSYYNKRNVPNLLWLRYEEMKQDMPSVLNKVSKFLKVPIKDFLFDSLMDHLSFGVMKYNFFCNHQLGLDIASQISKEEFEKDGKEWNDNRKNNFLRKGKIGSHKEEMSPEWIKKFDEWIKENTKNIDLKYD